MSAKKGDIVECEFWDHCEDGPATGFTVWGRVRKVTSVQIQIACWDYARPKKVDENVKIFSIVRTAIKSIKRLNFDR